MKYLTPLYTILSAKAATGIGTTVDVEQWDEIYLEFATADSANLTVKLLGSISESSPDFSAAKSVSNMYDFLAYTDADTVASELPDATSGATGIAVAGTDDFRILKIVCKGIKWLNAEVTARAAGSVTVKARGVKNVY